MDHQRWLVKLQLQWRAVGQRIGWRCVSEKNLYASIHVSVFTWIDLIQLVLAFEMIDVQHAVEMIDLML